MQEVWKTEKYYKKAHQASLETRYLGMKLLKKYASKSKIILDIGCGDGTRLNYIATKKQKAFGVDISPKAIKLAKRFKGLKFIKYDGIRLPFENSHFDLVYSAFVLEHIQNPDIFLKEAIRVLKISGYLVLMAPNFGSPNRASPPFKDSRLRKVVLGFSNDLFSFAKTKNKLAWNKVTPIVDKEYEVDFDVTVEPYARTLIEFLKHNNFKIEFFSCGWQYELPNARTHQEIFKFLAGLKIYPFNYWGPHIIIVARKNG